MRTSMAIAAAVVLMAAATARASPLVNPDLTITDLIVSYNAPNLDVNSDPQIGSVLSWTLPDGTPGGVMLGLAGLNWNGTTGTFDVWDDAISPLLSGTVLGLIVDSSGYIADVQLSLTSFDLGDRVNVFVGRDLADVAPVPEPTTMAMLLLGGGYIVAQRRKRRRAMTPTRS